MSTLKLTSETNTKGEFNNFIVSFKKSIKSIAKKVGSEMQKHANEAGQAIRS